MAITNGLWLGGMGLSNYPDYYNSDYRNYLMQAQQMNQLQKDHDQTIEKIENNKINDLTDEKLLLLIED